MKKFNYKARDKNNRRIKGIIDAKGDAKTAPRRVKKAKEAEERLSNLPGKALEQKKTRKHQPKIVSGVKVGEQIAGKGAFLLKAEMAKGESEH